MAVVEFPSVALAGFAGSGKSHLGHALVGAVGGTVVSFGACVARLAVERGLTLDRMTLVALGKQLVSELGMDEFIRICIGLADVTPPLILEGVRDRQALESLRRIMAPLPVPLIVLEVPAELRAQRVAQRRREGDDVKQLGLLNEIEGQNLVDLQREADLVLDGTLPVEELVKACKVFFLK